ncbi:MAG: T9SS type A sorting domain-containing protein [Hymenobacter sp.]|nr:MAG: T9SS type A sorting domain-containing protein [Hymenobacter sp.]
MNPTHVLCPAGTTISQNIASQLDATGSSISLEGDKTTFQLAGTVHLNPRGNSFVVGAGTLLELFSGSVFQLDQAQLSVEAGGTLLVHAGATIQGSGTLSLASGSYICVEPGATITATRNFGNYTIGTNPSLGLSGQNCQSSFLVAGNPTDAKTASTDEQYTVMPNPASDKVSVTLELLQASPVQISLQDLSGVTRFSMEPQALEAGKHTLDVPLNTLASGIYLLVVESADGRKTTRLEVSH